MLFHEEYRKNYVDLLIAVENFDISLSDEFYALKSANTARLIGYQIRKFEQTFDMLITQMKFYLERLQKKKQHSGASIITSFFENSSLKRVSYEILLEMNVSYRKLSLAYEQKNPSFNKNLYNKLDNYYTTMLLSLQYLDYDDAYLFKVQKEAISDEELVFV